VCVTIVVMFAKFYVGLLKASPDRHSLSLALSLSFCL